MLQDFVTLNRDEIIKRCRTKVSKRHEPPPTQMELEHGIPMFLEQLGDALRGQESSHAIDATASQHGRDLLRHGFTVSQVVHDYGDVCQTITELALEKATEISTTEFRTLNRCLDDAIAGAVTEHARLQEVDRAGDSRELRSLINAAITAFEVIATGNVGVGGSTGALLHRSLMGIRALSDLTEGTVAGVSDSLSVPAK